MRLPRASAALSSPKPGTNKAWFFPPTLKGSAKVNTADAAAELSGSLRLHFDTGDTDFRSPFKMHLANGTRTWLGSRKKGEEEGSEVGGRVRSGPRNLARRTVQEAAPDWFCSC